MQSHFFIFKSKLPNFIALRGKKYTLAGIIINTQYVIMSLILWIACFLTATWQSVVWAVERCDFVIGT